MICIVVYVCNTNSAGQIMVNFNCIKKKVIAKNIFSLNAIEMFKNNCANKYNWIKLIYKIMTNNKTNFFNKKWIKLPLADLLNRLLTD